MNGQELFELASALKIPLTTSTIEKSDLQSLVMSHLERLYADHPSEINRPLSDPAVQFSSVRKTFGKNIALANLSLTVHPGEIVGLVGPNGAGKTTTLRILTGIIRASRGTVTVNGHNIMSDAIAAKQRICYLPERPTCYSNLRVREYLTLISQIYGVPRHDVLIRIHRYVRLFELEKFMSSYVGTLSKGNLQRMLVVGLFLRPPPQILILDEPFQGLDPRGAWSLKKMIYRFREQGSAIIISTHVLQNAETLCDRFIILNNGIVVGQGTLEELRAISGGCKTLEDIFLSLTGGIPAEWM